jgi:hypothetical protein
VNQFNPRRDLSNPDAARWIEKNGKKLFQHAVDLEYAWNTFREGTDFTLGQGSTSGKVGEGTYVIWRNRSAIRVIPESLDMSPVGYFEFLAEGKSIGQDDQALLWKLKRRLDHSIADAPDWIPTSEIASLPSLKSCTQGQ